MGTPTPELTELVEEGKGEIKPVSSLPLKPSFSIPISPSPSLPVYLPLGSFPVPRPSFCLAVYPCLSLQFPHFCGTLFLGPSQYLELCCPLTQVLSTYVLPPVLPRTWAPGLVIRHAPPSDVLTLPLPAALGQEPTLGTVSPLQWLCNWDQ